MDFLLEIGVEEMPARFCAGMSEALLQGIVGLCRDERLFDTAAGVPGHGDSFVTPRRIAARVEFLRARQADRSEEVIGPTPAPAS